MRSRSARVSSNASSLALRVSMVSGHPSMNLPGKVPGSGMARVSCLRPSLMRRVSIEEDMRDVLGKADVHHNGW